MPMLIRAFFVFRFSIFFFSFLSCLVFCVEAVGIVDVVGVVLVVQPVLGRRRGLIPLIPTGVESEVTYSRSRTVEGLHGMVIANVRVRTGARTRAGDEVWVDGVLFFLWHRLEVSVWLSGTLGARAGRVDDSYRTCSALMNARCDCPRGAVCCMLDARHGCSRCQQLQRAEISAIETLFSMENLEASLLSDPKVRATTQAPSAPHCLLVSRCCWRS